MLHKAGYLKVKVAIVGIYHHKQYGDFKREIMNTHCTDTNCFFIPSYDIALLARPMNRTKIESFVWKPMILFKDGQIPRHNPATLYIAIA